MMKPELGIIPKKILQLQRLEDISGAIRRRLQNNQVIVLDWITEYNDLLSKFDKDDLERYEREVNSQVQDKPDL